MSNNDNNDDWEKGITFKSSMGFANRGMSIQDKMRLGREEAKRKLEARKQEARVSEAVREALRAEAELPSPVSRKAAPGASKEARIAAENAEGDRIHGGGPVGSVNRAAGEKDFRVPYVSPVAPKVLAKDHTPRSIPRLLRSIETKKLLRGDAPSGTELSKAKTRLEVLLGKWGQAIIEMRDEIAEIRENQATPEGAGLKKAQEIESDLVDVGIRLKDYEEQAFAITPKVSEGKC